MLAVPGHLLVLPGLELSPLGVLLVVLLALALPAGLLAGAAVAAGVGLRLAGGSPSGVLVEHFDPDATGEQTDATEEGTDAPERTGPTGEAGGGESGGA